MEGERESAGVELPDASPLDRLLGQPLDRLTGQPVERLAELPEGRRAVRWGGVGAVEALVGICRVLPGTAGALLGTSYPQACGALGGISTGDAEGLWKVEEGVPGAPSRAEEFVPSVGNA